MHRLLLALSVMCHTILLDGFFFSNPKIKDFPKRYGFVDAEKSQGLGDPALMWWLVSVFGLLMGKWVG